MPVPNYIEVKRSAERHDDTAFLACQSLIEDVLPGKVAILCDKHLEKTDGGVLIPDGKWRGKNDSDTGTVLHSNHRCFNPGDRVGFHPMHGIRLSQPDYSWVPEGCEIRIYGVAQDVLPNDGEKDSLVLLGEGL